MGLERVVRVGGLRLVDLIRKTDALSMYREFLDGEQRTPAEVEREQVRKVRELLVHAAAQVPHYTQLFRDLHFDPQDVRSLKDLRALPIVTKAEMRNAGDRFVAKNAGAFEPSHRSSSGTTGEPFSYLLSRQARSAQWASMYRQWNIGGWEPGDPIVYLGGTSLFPSIHAVGRWVYEHLNSWLALSAFDMRPESMDRWLGEIRRRGIRFMHAYPSSAHILATRALKTGVTMKFDAVITSAEVLHPHQRARIEEAFCCKVFDFYGANDGGAFAFECEQHAGLHGVAERAVIEIVRDDGSPAPDGEVGRVISTDLLNFAMPFIRYDAGDRAAMDPAGCCCGRGTPTLAHIAGRSNDYVRTPTGRRIHSGFFSYLVRGKPWVDQFQVVQESPTALIMYVKPRDGFPETDIPRIQEALAAGCEQMTVTVTVCDSIPAAPNGKYQYIVNHTLQRTPTT
jgi:phenylacetate-CoA ligase